MTRVLEIAQTWDGVVVGPDERARVTLTASDAGLEIAVDAPYHGDPAPPARPGPCDRLWQFEVVEVFLAGRAEPGDPLQRVPYTEIELSPHGHHLVLRLLGIRNPIDLALPLAYTAARHGGRWSGHAVVPRGYLPHGPLRGNAYALHGGGRERRYLAALSVPGPRPDFHRLDRFGDLELELPPSSDARLGPA